VTHNRKKSKKSGRGSSSANANESNVAVMDAVSEEPTVPSEEVDASSRKKKTKSVRRPGVIFERIDTLGVDPYIAGVAVKPY
jgi:hypothetical protein